MPGKHKSYKTNSRTQQQPVDEAASSQRSDANDTEALEVEAVEKVVNAMLYYQKYATLKLKRKAEIIVKMPQEDRQLVFPSYPDFAKKAKSFAEENQKLFNIIVNCGVNMLGDDSAIRKAYETTKLYPATEHYMSKARSTLKQIVRDWSVDGAQERSSCYDRVLKALDERYPDRESRHDLHVLVPGAGLSRLAWEVLQKGFSCTGNEFSMFMLLTSNFILNACQEKEDFTIYPYLLDFSNAWSYEDMLRPVTFPDVEPCFGSPSRKNIFAMCAGDFLQAFADESNKYDCILTVFFLDTAANPINYIRSIHRILRPGGVWLNFGPLTYHFEDAEDELSLELPFGEILRIIEKVGFRLDKVEGSEYGHFAKYTSNAESMLNFTYHCGFFECTKISL
ncbi:hypothetical protein AAVH_05411 [Aphelenchoides avenae]|nr:hypothetical protein AAVH_05411 [Aphelenchus avenae]